MIYTVTLNPALDYVIQVADFKTGKINRNKKEDIYYGGKGVNVSCILNELEIRSTALGFIAGFTGKALSECLLKKLQDLGADDMLILSGSIPSCMENDTYEKIIEVLDPSVNLVVDAERALLLKVLKFHPFLIKPNNVELAQIFETKIENEDDIIFYAKRLQKDGARNVLVSMAGAGAILG